MEMDLDLSSLSLNFSTIGSQKERVSQPLDPKKRELYDWPQKKTQVHKRQNLHSTSNLRSEACQPPIGAFKPIMEVFKIFKDKPELWKNREMIDQFLSIFLSVGLKIIISSAY